MRCYRLTTFALAGVLLFTANRVSAGLVSLNDPSFENSGAADTNVPDNTNFRDWGPNNNNIGTYNAGAGAGNNEGKWIIRTFSTDNLANGDLRQDAIAGKTGSQYFAYAVFQNPAARGAFQYVDSGGGDFFGDFELKVDIYSPVGATNSYILRVVGFDDPTEVLVDIGDSTNVTQTGGGTGGFEFLTQPGGWLATDATDATGAFVEKTFSGTFSGTYDYIGVMMGSMLTGGGASDLVGFDNVRLTAQITPEPSTSVLAVLGMVSIGFCRRRRKRA